MLKQVFKSDRDNFMKNEPVIIKKYNNRRLYNTKTSSYINLQEIFDMIRNQVDFVVIDSNLRFPLLALSPELIGAEYIVH